MQIGTFTQIQYPKNTTYDRGGVIGPACFSDRISPVDPMRKKATGSVVKCKYNHSLAHGNYRVPTAKLNFYIKYYDNFKHHSTFCEGHLLQTSVQ